MPLYEYRCSECDSAFSIRLRVGEVASHCSSCNSTQIKKHYGGTRTSKTDPSEGIIVTEFIEESKKTLEEYKESLRKKR